MHKQHPDNLSCSFCGKHSHEVRKLIAGPTVYICDQCVKLCNEIIGREAERAGTGAEQTPVPVTSEREARPPRQTLCCSFCGKSRRAVKKLIAGPSAYICDECLGLCNDIIAEEIEREDVKTRLRATTSEESLRLLAAILDRGASAAAQVLRFSEERRRKIVRGIRDQFPHVSREELRRHLLENASLEVLAEMSTLAFRWARVHDLVRPGAGQSVDGDKVSPAKGAPDGGSAVGDRVRQIAQRLNVTWEVLDSVATRVEEPGFEPHRPSLHRALETMQEAETLLMADPPQLSGG